LAILIDK